MQEHQVHHFELGGALAAGHQGQSFGGLSETAVAAAASAAAAGQGSGAQMITMNMISGGNFV